MFYDCENLESLDLKNFDFRLNQLHSIEYMLYKCKNLKKLTLSKYLGNKVSDLKIEGTWKNLLNGKIYIFNTPVPDGEYIKIN